MMFITLHVVVKNDNNNKNNEFNQGMYYILVLMMFLFNILYFGGDFMVLHYINPVFKIHLFTF